MSGVSAWDDKIIEEFRENGGEVGQFGRSLVLMHHRGAKSGTERVTPVMAIPDGDGWLVAASKAGAPDNPAWFHNLVAHPTVEIQDGADRRDYGVRLAEGKERQEWWARAVEVWSDYADYQQRTDREIPVFIAEPV